ncbi:MAG: YfaP family protein [Planctomycetota bacterium]|jgi:uncharacterized protein YfaP (DUF2135 family)
MTKRHVWIVFAAAAFLSLALIAPRPAGGEDGPVAKIEAPRGGWTTERILTFSGTAGGKGVARAVLVINGADKEVAVEDGRFEAKEVVSPGRNTVRLVVQDAEGRVARDSVTFYAKVPDRDLKITVNWDTDGTDMDMHVVDPKGETCMYNHNTTKIGGKLDIDVTDGFGPETFTLANAVKGKYKVYVHYYGPGNGPVTVATVWIILYEGTPREQREKRELVLKAKDEKPLAWEFEVE